MNLAPTIFFAGMGGVFLGMAMLYGGIKLMPHITQRLERDEEKV